MSALNIFAINMINFSQQERHIISALMKVHLKNNILKIKLVGFVMCLFLLKD